MKTLKNEKFEFKGMPIQDENKNILDTLATLRLVLEQSAYTSAAEVLKASVILGKLPTEGEEIELEDADYDFLKIWVNKYAPLISKGTMFASFFGQFQ